MAITYTIWANPRVAFAKYDGIIKTEDVEVMFHHYLSHPDFSPEIPHFADVTRIEDADSSASEVRALAEMYTSEYKRLGTRMQTAHLVEKGGFSLGISRMFEAFAEAAGGLDIFMSNSIDEINEWLENRAPKSPPPLSTTATYLIKDGIVSELVNT